MVYIVAYLLDNCIIFIRSLKCVTVLDLKTYPFTLMVTSIAHNRDFIIWCYKCVSCR